MKYLSTSFTITPPSDIASDILSALLADVGYETFLPSQTGLDAWIQESLYDESLVRSTIQAFPLDSVSITFSTQPAPDEDWNAQWEQEGFQPIFIEQDGRLLVAVHDTAHTDIPTAEYDIIIHPRQAFGTGSHQTTRMILRQLCRMDLAGLHVVDAGTGTGILSILAAKRGAEFIFAYDIDEWSVQNTRDNLLLNNITNVEVALGDSSLLSASSSLLSTSSSQLPTSHSQLPTSHLLIANINRNILLADLPTFVATLAPSGMLLLSGFYHQDVPILVSTAQSLGMSLVNEDRDGEWSLLLFQKNRCEK